jgi:valyl-tRNA synthetase
MPRFAARKKILADLEAAGLLIKTEPHSHAVGHCSRCGETVEPMVSEQWFVKMEPLAAKSLDCVDNGGIKFVPERFVKTFDNWMNSARDWCISRQLWWGHRIPAWYCEKCGKITVSREEPTECSHCGSHDIHQDEDVLDTWFSSALWPFSTLGWPEKTPELEYFYPTSVLVTGYDILFFWVARMIFSGLEQMGERPFETVLFHGLIRDAEGRKMSKSLGNGVDPLEVIDEYGADALRFNIITGNSPGNDMRYFPARCEAMRNFANKIWNASRFVLLNLTVPDCTLPPESELRAEDKWILTRLHDTVAEVLTNFDVLELGIAANSLYDFIWTGFCDWYIELVKPRLLSENATEKQSCEKVLLYVLTHMLKALHPFMPFITEYVWQQIPAADGVIMTQPYPEADKIPHFPEDARRFDAVRDAISAIRTRRSEMNVPQKMQPSLIIETDSPEDFTAGAAQIKKLAGISEITVTTSAPSGTDGYAVIATAAAKLYLPLAELVDLAEERARLEREIAAAEKNLAGVAGKLSNEQFMSKAPEGVVQKERDRLAELTTLIENLKSALSRT